MNVGYTNARNAFKTDSKCPICEADVYGSKYGGDFRCMNKECILNKIYADKMIDLIKEVIEGL